MIEDDPGCLYTPDTRHTGIHDDDRRLAVEDELQRFFTAASLADDLHIRLVRYQAGNAAANQFMVIDKEDGD